MEQLYLGLETISVELSAASGLSGCKIRDPGAKIAQNCDTSMCRRRLYCVVVKD